MHKEVLVGKPEGNNHFEDLRTDGMVILHWVLGKWTRMVFTNSFCQG